MKEQRKMKQELNKLKSDSVRVKDNENLSPNRAVREEQVRFKMQKEIEIREETIVDLRCQIDVLSAQTRKCENRMTAMEHEMKKMRDDYSEVSVTVDGLKSDIEHKEQIILTLEETNNELRMFINETRSTVNKDESSECLDFSFSTSMQTAGNSSDGGENLAKYVIDVQLKEKEMENEQLKVSMLVMTGEKQDLEVILREKANTIVSLESDLKRTLFDNSKLSLEMDTLRSRIDEVSKENETLKSGLQQSKEAVEEMKRHVHQQMEALGNQLKSAQEARNQFQEILETEKANFINLRQSNESEIASLRVGIFEKSTLLEQKCIEIESMHINHKSEVDEIQIQTANAIEKVALSKDAMLTMMDNSLRALLKDSEKNRISVEESLVSKNQILSKQVEDLVKMEGELKVSNDERKSCAAKHEIQIKEMQKVITEKECTVQEMIKEIQGLKSVHLEREQKFSDEKLVCLGVNSQVQDLLKKLEKYKIVEDKLRDLEISHEKEKIFNNKINEESQIVLAKMMKAREANDELTKKFNFERKQLEAENAEMKRKTDEEIKETRSEMEGKLDKMKEKMVRY